ncbi:acyl-CoA dehydrogenase family protein [Cryptosporangium sp. NPDC051539]|uniref:acyl-CoA dehydrogenase family protein n=1 Tax=Cryptosporangium sp. NPDC051539 TaxID=3363962 RepID=UPI0037B31995
MTVLDPELRDIAETVRTRARRRLEPLAADLDRAQTFAPEVWAELRELDLFRLPFAEEKGGIGASTLAYVVALEQVASACATAALYPGTTTQVGQTLLAHAEPSLTDRWLSRVVTGEVVAAWAFTEPQTGSDPKQLTTRARRDRDGGGWVLDGQKAFISYAGVATVALVFALTADAEVSAFLVETGQPGWTVGPAVDVLAFGGTEARPVYLDAVRVPSDGLVGVPGQGFDVMLSGEALGKLRVAAINVGVAQRALDEATAYARQRTHRGESIGEKFTSIQNLLADMSASVLAARALLHETAEHYDAGAPIGPRAAALRLVTGRAAREVTSAALQVCGAYGLTRDLPVERLYREAKFYEVAQGSMELQRVIVGKHVLRPHPSQL